MKQLIILFCFIISQFSFAQSISGRYFGELDSDYINFQDRLYFYNDTLLFYRSLAESGSPTGHRYYDYNMIDDSTYIINAKDTSRLEVIEKTLFFNRLFLRDIAFIMEAQSGHVPLQFKSFDLYVLTTSNDTMLYKSEQVTNSMYFITIPHTIKINAFWMKLSNGIITEKYYVNSKRSNSFELYIYCEPIYRKQILKIRDNKIFINEQEFNRVEQTHYEIEKYVHRRSTLR